MTDRSFQTKNWLQPLDRTALIVIAVLTVLIGLLLLNGDRTAPRIRDFTWNERQVGSADRAFILTFSRPMDRASVENNLRIEPPLPGKFSWAGRRMAYTLNQPAPYGQAFELQLQGARDRFTQAGDDRSRMPLFSGQFNTRDRAFVYLGVQGDQEGRLVLQNLTHQEEQILTPKNLVVMDFKPYPQGDRILFTATNRSSQNQGLLDQKLYSVTTGIQIQPPLMPGMRQPRTRRTAQAAGQVEEILDSRTYQNLKFDLSADGQTIIVQRVNRQNPAEFGLWVVQEGEPPRPLETEPGGDFLIAPDSSSLAMTQGQGLAILPLEPNADPLDFLPKFGMILSFAQDGTAAAVVKFNVDDPLNPTRSLFLVTNQGDEKELLETDGSILSAQFDPTRTMLYALYTTRLPSDELYLEEPYLAAINLKTAERIDLLRLPIQRDIQMSLSPDGLGLLFDQAITAEDGSQPGLVRSSEGKAIADSRLWFLPLTLNDAGLPTPTEPQAIPLSGLRPRWLP